MSAQRIYLVRSNIADSGALLHRLVRAPNAAQALRYVAAATLSCEVATQDALVSLVGRGVKVEASGRETEPDELPF